MDRIFSEFSDDYSLEWLFYYFMTIQVHECDDCAETRLYGEENYYLTKTCHCIFDHTIFLVSHLKESTISPMETFYTVDLFTDDCSGSEILEESITSSNHSGRFVFESVKDEDLDRSLLPMFQGNVVNDFSCRINHNSLKNSIYIPDAFSYRFGDMWKEISSTAGRPDQSETHDHVDQKKKKESEQRNVHNAPVVNVKVRKNGKLTKKERLALKKKT